MELQGMESKVQNNDKTKDGVKNYLELSQEFQEQQLYRKAEDTLLFALEKLPNHPHLLANLSKLYNNLDITEKALGVINRLIKHHGELSFPYFLRGKIYEELGEAGKAISDFKRSLTYSEKDLSILRHLLPLMLTNAEASDTLELIRVFQELFNNIHLFAELQAEAYLQLQKNVQAFNKMREALLQEPGDKRLLKRYLELSNQTNKKTPLEVYKILNRSLPGLVELSDRDIFELESDYLIKSKKYPDALRRMNKAIKENSKNYFLRKKKAFLLLEMGFVNESTNEFRILFLENSEDLEVRKVLENYYIANDKLDEWKKLVKQALENHSDQIELFKYLRSIGMKQNWLAICELGYDEFFEQLEKINLSNADTQDVTYVKLPYYAFEIFICQVVIKNTIPTPLELWSEICNARQKKNQIPPFHLEDLEAAYPVWMITLNLYFLFKSYSKYPVAFIPSSFQDTQIALTIAIKETLVSIDISQLLSGEKKRLKTLVKAGKGFRWRILPSHFEPAVNMHGIRFYSPDQFGKLVKEIELSLEKTKNGQTV